MLKGNPEGSGFDGGGTIAFASKAERRPGGSYQKKACSGSVGQLAGDNPDSMYLAIPITCGYHWIRISD